MADLMTTLKGLRNGETTYEDVKKAVAEHQFTPLEPVDTIEKVTEQWDYTPTEGSFKDTVWAAYWMRLITKDQLNELREIAFGEQGER